MGDISEASDSSGHATEHETSVLLLDLENCPHHLNHLPKSLEQFDRVIICYAQRGPKVPLDWLVPLSKALQQERLTIHKMDQTGKNSADFGICFFAGLLAQELPLDTHFVIVSNDGDLDHAIQLLHRIGRSAERVGSQKVEPNSESDDDQALARYCRHLTTYRKNRPAREDTLRNSIRNKFKADPALAGRLYEALVREGVIIIDGGRVQYNDEAIARLLRN
ncbi:PIN domain-containing protein [Halopseudomonas salegens]|uniref:NYN domain-containing protein n=1 Tax=Halopseudomonas salegens TaxID=1434072 RepID=A0A1H2ECE6_9GAMM|nr:PIN domain-containing protein [Halopseudomonas salegens]SDT92802.1 NYN domain-containing protein [Halopseudomonas salegens]